MIWQYFPIGFRFPVRDFSDETKRACWNIALSALYAGDPSGVTLYDAQETYDFGSDGPVYQCIACFYGIKQSRAAAKGLMSLDRLMTRLCRHVPFMQANALESFGPYPLLGRIGENKTVIASDIGAALFDGLKPEPMKTNDGMRLLIVSDGTEADTRALGIAAADLGLCVRRMQISDGKNGLVRALVNERNGRFETVALTDADGGRVNETIGVLPHRIAVLDTEKADENTVSQLIEKTLDLGYRDIRTGSGCTADGTSSIGIDELLHMIDFESAAKQADFVLLHAKTDTAQAALNELNALQKPACLLARSEADETALMQEYSVLRRVAAVSDGADMQNAFRIEVLPCIGKDIAKTQWI